MIISSSAPRAHLRDILDAVLTEYPHLTRTALLSPSRSRVHVRPRWVAFVLARELGGHSLPRIGKYFNRDHTTVLHGLRRMAELCQTDIALDVTVATLRRRIMEALAPDSGEAIGFRARLRRAVMADDRLKDAAERAARKAEPQHEAIA